MYNKKAVIDQIAEYELYDVLTSRKSIVICYEIWNGRYETEPFMNYSLNYRIVNAIFFKTQTFSGYSPNFLFELSKIVRCFRDDDTLYGKKRRKKIKAHAFMFKSWEKSMVLRYLIDALFIIAVSIFLQIKINEFMSTLTSYYAILDDYNAKQAKANDSSLSPADRANAKYEFSKVEDEYLSINNDAYDMLMMIYYYWIVFTAYFVRNVCQIIYAKLRHKNWTVITEEIVLSSIHLFLVVVSLYRHYT